MLFATPSDEVLGCCAARYRRLTEAFMEPLYVVTLDVDWASDACILDTVEFLNDYGIVPTLFTTHPSDAVAALARSGAVEVGIHPNFLPNSSHGSSVSEVLDSVMAICPDPIAVRCHSYMENSHIMAALYERGLRFDSNLCLFMQPFIVPLRHWSGLWRFPVFWEDDVHWQGTRSWDYTRYQDVFTSPGLKIVDVHPFVQALNIPSQSDYDRLKRFTKTLSSEDVLKMRCDGDGARSFLIEMIESIFAAGKRFMTFSDLISIFSGRWDREAW